MGTLEPGGGDGKKYGVREGELNDAQRTEGRCQLEQERRGSPTECGDKAVEMSVAQLSVGVDQLKNKNDMYS